MFAPVFVRFFLATTIVAVFLAAGRLLRCLHLFLSDFSETS